jgi:hypothetical protein
MSIVDSLVVEIADMKSSKLGTGDVSADMKARYESAIAWCILYCVSSSIVGVSSSCYKGLLKNHC